MRRHVRDAIQEKADPGDEGRLNESSGESRVLTMTESGHLLRRDVSRCVSRIQRELLNLRPNNQMNVHNLANDESSQQCIRPKHGPAPGGVDPELCSFEMVVEQVRVFVEGEH